MQQHLITAGISLGVLAFGILGFSAYHGVKTENKRLRNEIIMLMSDHDLEKDQGLSPSTLRRMKELRIEETE